MPAQALFPAVVLGGFLGLVGGLRVGYQKLRGIREDTHHELYRQEFESLKHFEDYREWRGTAFSYDPAHCAEEQRAWLPKLKASYADFNKQYRATDKDAYFSK
jgi:hypothetical protein